MKLWKLKPTTNRLPPQDPHLSNWAPSPWCEWASYTSGFVIRAETAQQARQVAASHLGEQHWLDPFWTTCDEIPIDGEPGVVFRSEYSPG